MEGGRTGILRRLSLDEPSLKAPHDTVYEELKGISHITRMNTDDLSMAMAIYMLGFSNYSGFNKLITIDNGKVDNENLLRVLYDYATRFSRQNE